MYKIAFSYMNNDFADKIKLMLNSIFKEESIEYCLTEFIKNKLSPQEIINELYNNYDLYILDILLLDNDNIDYKLISKNLNITIIVTTSMQNKFVKNNVMYNRFYLLNPISFNILKRVIIYDYVKHFINKDILIEKGTHLFRIHEKDITYIEVENRGINIHLINNVIYFSEKISVFQKRLSSAVFNKCHKSFIVNMNYVTQVYRYEVVMSNNEIIPISKSHYNEMKEKLLKLESGYTQIKGILIQM